MLSVKLSWCETILALASDKADYKTQNSFIEHESLESPE